MTRFSFGLNRYQTKCYIQKEPARALRCHACHDVFCDCLQVLETNKKSQLARFNLRFASYVLDIFTIHRLHLHRNTRGTRWPRCYCLLRQGEADFDLCSECWQNDSRFRLESGRSLIPLESRWVTKRHELEFLVQFPQNSPGECQPLYSLHVITLDQYVDLLTQRNQLTFDTSLEVDDSFSLSCMSCRQADL